MVSPVIQMRPEVEKFFHVIDLPLPDDEELYSLQNELGKQHNIKPNRKAARAAKGLTEFEAETAYALSLIRRGYFSTRIISEAKGQMIKKSGLMEFWEPANISDVGGLGNFKSFIENRSKAFSPENQNLPQLKGILLVGIPGTGKSLSSKATASILGWPLIRLDIGSLKNSLVGQSEARRHYTDHFYMAKKWIGEWEKLSCEEVSRDKIPKFIMKRAEVSAYTANKDLRYLRALFNFGISRNWITENPTRGLSFFPVEKRLKYIPRKEDVLKVIAAADPDTQDYLWAIKETMGRMGEINRLTWSDVNLEERYVVLYTRKKKGGHLTPRKVPMTQKLFEVLSRRYEKRVEDKPWVFWQRYWDRKKKEWVEGPYRDRKSFMKTLCKKTKVPYFRFHALRHLSALSWIEKMSI
jgi:integrase